MESEVTFRDDATGSQKQVTLVYPKAADIDAGRISVLTPIGAALIGLSAGQAISFDNTLRRTEIPHRPGRPRTELTA